MVVKIGQSFLMQCVGIVREFFEDLGQNLLVCLVGQSFRAGSGGAQQLVIQGPAPGRQCYATLLDFAEAGRMGAIVVIREVD